MDRVIKNFLFYSNVPENKLLFYTPELVGKYLMRVLQYTTLENSANMFTINSPQLQLLTNQSRSPNYIYNPYNFDIQFINFMLIGIPVNRNIVFDDLVAIMDMNGRFDYQHCYFNPAWGGNPLGFTYIQNNKLLITAEFTKIPEKIYKSLPYNIEHKKKRILANILASPYSTNTPYYSFTDTRLVGRFRVKLLNNYCSSEFPENIGIYIISPQFSSSILGGKYYLSEARNSRRTNFGYSSDDVIGDFYGRCNFTVYNSRYETEENILYAIFVFAFEEV